MGLPSKKQLHKHKRGTRKALDTLEAMEVENDIPKEEPDVEDLIFKKKSKKTSEAPLSNKTEIEQPSVESEVKTPVETSVEDLETIELNEETPGRESAEIVEDVIPQKDEDLSDQIVESQESEEKLQPEISEETPGDKEVAAVKSEPLMTNELEQQEVEVNSNDSTPAEAPEGDEQKPEPDEKNGEEGLEDTQKDKYLTFKIGEENFGISIQYVTEIIVIQRITEVPNTPAFVKGVINLRGKVIPVIDIRKRFGLDLRDYDERTCVIVVEHSETSVGMIVDTVNEVLDIPQQNVDPPPRSHSGIESSYLEGMGKIDKQVVILLELGKVLFVEELLRMKRDYDE